MKDEAISTGVKKMLGLLDSFEAKEQAKGTAPKETKKQARKNQSTEGTKGKKTQGTLDGFFSKK